MSRHQLRADKPYKTPVPAPRWVCNGASVQTHEEVQIPPQNLPAKPSPMQRGTGPGRGPAPWKWSIMVTTEPQASLAAVSPALTIFFFHRIRSRKIQAGNDAISGNYFSYLQVSQWRKPGPKRTQAVCKVLFPLLTNQLPS